MRAITADISRSYVGISGIFNTKQSADLSQSVCRFIVQNYSASRFDLSSNSCTLVQQIAPGIPLASMPHNVKNETGCTALAGTIWCTSQADGIESGTAVHRALVSARVANKFEPLTQIQGDFIGAQVGTDSALIARCATSTKPLFYRYDQGILKWSTRLMDLVQDPFGEIDFNSLVTIAFGDSAFPYPSISILPPGYFIRAAFAKIEVSEYDPIDPDEAIAEMPLSELATNAREMLLESVAEQSAPFRKVGLLLSGGIDSSSIAWCLAELGRDCHCYNWSSKAYPPADESRYAENVSSAFGLPFSQIDIAESRDPGGGLLDPSWRFDFPFNHSTYKWWSDAVTTARSEVDALATGRYGDDTFGGERTIALNRSLSSLSWADTRTVIWQSLALRLPTFTLIFGRDVRPRTDVLNVRRADYFTAAAMDALRTQLTSPRTDSELLQASAMEEQLMRPAGLSIIAPYRSKKLIALKKSIPHALRQVPFAGAMIDKLILRLAMMDRLPPQVLRRTTSANYDALIQQYASSNPHVIAQILGGDALLTDLGIIDPGLLDRTLSSTQNLRKNAITLVVSSLVELWLKSIAQHQLMEVER